MCFKRSKKLFKFKELFCENSNRVRNTIYFFYRCGILLFWLRRLKSWKTLLLSIYQTWENRYHSTGLIKKEYLASCNVSGKFTGNEVYAQFLIGIGIGIGILIIVKLQICTLWQVSSKCQQCLPRILNILFFVQTVINCQNLSTARFSVKDLEF